MELRDRVAVVTGAGSGIGAAMARALAREGMRVAVADIDAASAGAVARELAQRGGRARAWRADVGQAASLTALAEGTREAFGPCAVLCANVGVQQLGRLERLTDPDWEWLLAVNVMGTVHTLQAFLPQLREAGRSQVVVTASTQALLPVPHLGGYTASKFAVLGYAETLRLELAPEGIGVTVLLPGPTATGHLASSGRARPQALGPSRTEPEDLPAVTAATLASPADLVEPDFAVRELARAIREDWPYLVTHPPQREGVAERFRAILEAFDRARD